MKKESVTRQPPSCLLVILGLLPPLARLLHSLFLVLEDSSTDIYLAQSSLPFNLYSNVAYLMKALLTGYFNLQTPLPKSTSSLNSHDMFTFLHSTHHRLACYTYFIYLFIVCMGVSSHISFTKPDIFVSLAFGYILCTQDGAWYITGVQFICYLLSECVAGNRVGLWTLWNCCVFRSKVVKYSDFMWFNQICNP